MSRFRSNNRIAGAFPGGDEDHCFAEKTALKWKESWINSIRIFIGPIYSVVNQVIEQCSPNKQVQLCLFGILFLCVSCQVPDRPERAHADPGEKALVPNFWMMDSVHVTHRGNTTAHALIPAHRADLIVAFSWQRE